MKKLRSLSRRLEVGQEVELEHGDDPKQARQIARDHIDELPDYYSRLAKMEKRGKKYWGIKESKEASKEASPGAKMALRRKQGKKPNEPYDATQPPTVGKLDEFAMVWGAPPPLPPEQQIARIRKMLGEESKLWDRVKKSRAVGFAKEAITDPVKKTSGATRDYFRAKKEIRGISAEQKRIKKIPVHRVNIVKKAVLGRAVRKLENTKKSPQETIDQAKKTLKISVPQVAVVGAGVAVPGVVPLPLTVMASKAIGAWANRKKEKPVTSENTQEVFSMAYNLLSEGGVVFKDSPAHKAYNTRITKEKKRVKKWGVRSAVAGVGGGVLAGAGFMLGDRSPRLSKAMMITGGTAAYSGLAGGAYSGHLHSTNAVRKNIRRKLLKNKYGYDDRDYASTQDPNEFLVGELPKIYRKKARKAYLKPHEKNTKRLAQAEQQASEALRMASQALSHQSPGRYPGLSHRSPGRYPGW